MTAHAAATSTPIKRVTMPLGGATNSISAAGVFDTTQRYLVCLPVATTRWRLVIGNIKTVDGSTGTTPGTITGTWFGTPAIATSGNRRWDGSYTATPTQALSSFSLNTDGTDTYSPWVTDSTLQLAAGVGSMVSIGVLTVNSGTGVASGGNSQMYARTTSGSSLAGAQTVAAIGINHGYLLDVRIEIEAATNMPVGLFIGDSITEGHGDGDATATQIMALSHETPGGAAGLRYGFLWINGGIGSAQTSQWTTSTDRRYSRFDLTTTVPDFAVINLGENDVGGTLSAFQSSMASVVTAIRTLNIKRVYLATVTPGNWGATPEAVRVSLNEWIRCAPLGVNGVIDYDAVISASPGAATQWTKYVSGDGVHPLRAGYQRMAGELASIRVS